MIDFPHSTYVHRKIPKEAFYRHLEIKNNIKQSFISDIESIYIENVLNNNSLNLDKKGSISEIDILLVELKRQDFNRKIIENIARDNNKKIVFETLFEDNMSIYLYEGRLYGTEWKRKDESSFSARGNSLDSIWENFVSDIALKDESGIVQDLSIRERLERNDKLKSLEKEIEKIDKQLFEERQPKRKIELFRKKEKLLNKKEGIINGKT